MAREKGMGNLQREKSGRWTMRVSINGKRYARSTRTKDRDQAERVLQRFLAPFGLGENRLPLADVWFEYIKSPKRNELAPATLVSKRQAWMHFAKWMEHSYLFVKDLGGVTSDMVAEYLACLRIDLCGTSYNNRVCVLREIFRTLEKKAGLESDPWDGIRLRPDDSHSRRELSDEELHRLLCAAKTNGDDWYKLILVGIYTGLRLGDCCRLEWSHINISEEVIQIVPNKTRRHHQRLVTIPIHPSLSIALFGAKIEKAKTKFSGPVLPNINLMYIRSRWQVNHELSKIFKAANIRTSIKLEGRRRKTPEATFHSLRHTFVSFAANAGVPLHIVQSIVGHESTAMTRHYYHENITALRSAVWSLPKI